MTLDNADSSLGDGTLEHCQKATHVIIRVGRTDDQVDVLGHEHISPKVKAMPEPSPVNGFE